MSQVMFASSTKKDSQLQNKEAEHKEQGAEYKNQDGDGAPCAKRTVHKRSECNRRINTHA